MRKDSSERVVPSLPENAVYPVKMVQRDERISTQQHDVDRPHHERAEGSRGLSVFGPRWVGHSL